MKAEHISEPINADFERLQQPVAALVRNALRRAPEELLTTIIDCGPHYNFSMEQIRFAELDRYSERFARALSVHGIGVGDRVGVFLPACNQDLIASLAIWKLGAIRVIMECPPDSSDVATIIAATDMKAVVVLSQYYLLGGLFMQHACKALKVFTVGLGNATAAFDATLDFNQICRQGDAAFDAEVTDGQLPAQLAPTSGTTGLPKYALFTQAALSTIFHHYAEWQAGACFGPLLYLGGIGPHVHAVWGAILDGRPIVQIPQIKDSDDDSSFYRTALAVLESTKISLIMGVREKYARLSSKKLKLKGVVGLSGGSALGTIAETFSKDTGAKLFEQYGMTECSVVTRTPRAAPRPGSVGIALRWTDLKIVDPATLATRNTGEHGEILVRGPQFMCGYWNNKTATKALFTDDGFLRTGDIGYMSNDGYLYVVDRMKNIIIVEGDNVIPAEVEDVILRCPDVQQCVVVGVTEPHWFNERKDFQELLQRYGELVVAFVVPRPTAKREGLEARIRECIRSNRLAKYKRPQQIVLLEQLPVAGRYEKIDRARLQSGGGREYLLVA